MRKEETVKVIIGKRGGEIEEPLSFHVPSHLRNRVKLGSFVVVDVGGRLTTGCVVKEEGEGERAEPILALLPIPPLPPSLLALAHFISHDYLVSLQSALQSIAPEVLSASPRLIFYPLTEHAKVRGRVKRLIMDEARKGLTYTSLKALPFANIRQKVLSLLEAGYLSAKVELRFAEREEKRQFLLPPSPPLVPSPWELGDKRGTMIWGGDRRERMGIYAYLIHKHLWEGGSVILLFPHPLWAEWAVNLLSPYAENIVLFHRAMPLKERYELWKRMAGSILPTLVVGDRGALFAPLRGVRLLIVEGDGEYSLRNRRPPYYEVGAVAFQRAVQEGAKVVFGSDIPSLMRLAWAKNQILDLHKLPFSMGQLRIEDIRGKRHIIPPPTREEIRDTLDQGKKVLLVVNKRGLFRLYCRDCGFYFLCPSCETSLMLQEEGGERYLQCFLCGRKEKAPEVCPVCGGHRIAARGIGTQRLISAVKRMFPKANVASLTTEAPSQAVWEADVVVGTTRAIIPWLFLLNPTLSCLFEVDATLSLPHFSQRERVYRLLFSLRSRSERLVIHTGQPNNPFFSLLPEEFLEMEVKTRQERQFPPFGHILTFLIEDSEEDKARLRAEEIYEKLGKRFPFLPPFPSFYPKEKGVFRYLLVLPTPSLSKAREALRAMQSLKLKNWRWFLDSEDML